MSITTLSGFVLKSAMHKYPPIAAFQPLVNGVGGNLVAVQASRISTGLHRARKNQVKEVGSIWPYVSPWHAFMQNHEDSVAARILIAISIPGNLIFINTIFSFDCGFSNTVPFTLSFLAVSLTQIIALLYLCQLLVRAMWVIRIDPDSSAIPLLTAIGDLLGGLLLIVLSRNHAVMSFRDGCFFLRDTKSSNGTFVNNERLAVTGEESEARQIFTGDIIQFGVEIVENTNKVAHGCIYAMVQLYDVDGQLIEGGGTMNAAEHNNFNASCGPSLVNNHQLFQLQQYLSEAMYREEARQQKLDTLEQLLESTEQASEAAWKALVNEDRLLSRIETLEAQLATYAKSANPDKLREDMQNLIEDKAKFESVAKEGLRRAQEERAESALRLTDIDRSLVSTEEECNRLRQRIQILEARLNDTVIAYDAKHNEWSLAQSAFMEAEKRILVAEERANKAEVRVAEVEKDNAYRERSVSSLVRLLINALNNSTSDDEQSLSLLNEVLRERNGDLESVRELPHPKENDHSVIGTIMILKFAVVISYCFIFPKGSFISGMAECNKCLNREESEEREAAVRAEMESYLKENLQLQARVREMEAELTASTSTDVTHLELSASQSVGTAPRKLEQLHRVPPPNTVLTVDVPSLQVDDPILAMVCS
uniref:FHA domain-containing protein n=1 Tax=Heterorhabditis bacteriophora TaxID=37862 RepID=A0A1I7XIH9_HETBA